MIRRSNHTGTHFSNPFLTVGLTIPAEMAGAILFLLPPTVAAGAWFLIIVFCAAVLLHVAHGQFEVGGLLIYDYSLISVD